MIGYAIKNPQGVVYIGTIQEDREDCIDEYFDRYKIGRAERDRRWVERQEEGFACVKVEIKEIVNDCVKLPDNGQNN